MWGLAGVFKKEKIKTHLKRYLEDSVGMYMRVVLIKKVTDSYYSTPSRG